MGKTLSEGVRAWAQGRRPDADHPRIEELVSYHAGEIAGEEEERLQEHLSLCPECTQLLLDLDGFEKLAPPEDKRHRAAADVEGAWQKLTGRLSAEPEAAGAGVLPFQPPPRHGKLRRYVLQPLVAVLTIAVVALSFWVATLRRELRALSQPQSAVQVIDLFADEDVRYRREKHEEIVQASRGAETLVLLLRLVEARIFPAYRIELSDNEGNVLWQRDGLQPNEDESFPLTIAGSFFSPGLYEIRLFGSEGESHELLRSYQIRVVDAPATP